MNAKHVQSLPELGRFTTDVQVQKDRAARKQAVFAVRGGPILLLPPPAKYGRDGNDALALYVVQVIEVSPPPKGEKPIEWTLLTTEPVSPYFQLWP